MKKGSKKVVPISTRPMVPTKVCYIAFKFLSDEKTCCGGSWLQTYNVAASKVIGNVTHCELVFKDRRNDYYERYLIRLMEYAKWSHHSNFNAKEWIMFQVLLTEEETEQCYKLCSEQIANGLKYDACVHYNMLAPSFCASSEDDKGWCTKQTIEILSEIFASKQKTDSIQRFLRLDPLTTTPLKLYNTVVVMRDLFQNMSTSELET